MAFLPWQHWWLIAAAIRVGVADEGDLARFLFPPLDGCFVVEMIFNGKGEP